MVGLVIPIKPIKENGPALRVVHFLLIKLRICYQANVFPILQLTALKAVVIAVDIAVRLVCTSSGVLGAPYAPG